MTWQNKAYRRRARAQALQWVEGNSQHNSIDDECCPDFSCCNPDLFEQNADKRWEQYKREYGASPQMCLPCSEGWRPTGEAWCGECFNLARKEALAGPSNASDEIRIDSGSDADRKHVWNFSKSFTHPFCAVCDVSFDARAVACRSSTLAGDKI